MKSEFIEYLEDIGLTKSPLKRIEAIYEICKELISDDIIDIFVTEYLQDDGSREYESLWFFSDKCFIEAKQFLTTFNFDISPTKNNIAFWNTKLQKYDFKEGIKKTVDFFEGLLVNER